MMEGARHRLAGDLGRAIEILVVEGMFLVHRLADGIAVHRRRGRIDQTPHALGDARLQHVEGAAHVHIERRARKIVTLQQPQRREVEDAIGAVKRALKYVRLEDITADIIDFDSRVAEAPRRFSMRPGTKLS